MFGEKTGVGRVSESVSRHCEILKAFERSEADVLAVVDHPDHRATIGTRSEAHVLRTCGEELERRNQELFSR